MVPWSILVPEGVFIMKNCSCWSFSVQLCSAADQYSKFWWHSVLSPRSLQPKPLSTEKSSCLHQLFSGSLERSSPATLLTSLCFFPPSFVPLPLSCRNLLHHFTVHLRGWDQLRAVALPPLPVRTPRRHQPRLRLVHVLCVGGPGPHSHLWLLLHPGPFCPTCPQDQLPQI